MNVHGGGLYGKRSACGVPYSVRAFGRRSVLNRNVLRNFIRRQKNKFVKPFILFGFVFFIFFLSIKSSIGDPLPMNGYPLPTSSEYAICIRDFCLPDARTQNIDDESVSSGIQLNNLSTLAEIRHAERLLRERFIGRPSSELIRYLQSRDFRCGSIGALRRAELEMSCRRSWPGSWFPFSFARTTTIMFRGKTESVEVISIIAKLDNFL